MHAEFTVGLLDLDLVVRVVGELALAATDTDTAAIDRDFDALRQRDGRFSYA